MEAKKREIMKKSIWGERATKFSSKETVLRRVQYKRPTPKWKWANRKTKQTLSTKPNPKWKYEIKRLCFVEWFLYEAKRWNEIEKIKGNLFVNRVSFNFSLSFRLAYSRVRDSHSHTHKHWVKLKRMNKRMNEQASKRESNIDNFNVASNHIQLIRLLSTKHFLSFCLSLLLAVHVVRVCAEKCTMHTTNGWLFTCSYSQWFLLLLVLFFSSLFSFDFDPDFFKVVAVVVVTIVIVLLWPVLSVCTVPFIAYFISIKRLCMALKC